MTDLVEQLRERHGSQYPMPGGPSLFTEAADEIERVRERLFHARNLALEEAAQVAEGWETSSWQDEHFAAQTIAATIRALKGGE